MTTKRRLQLGTLVGAIMVIIGCGGGAGAPKLNPGVGTSSSLPQPAPPPPVPPTVQTPPPLYPDKPATRADAARFLNQATFGATSAEVDRLMSIGYNAWIDEQFAMPRKQTFRNWYLVDGPQSNPADYGDPNSDRVSAAWYTLATQQPDQLRYRTTWALSQVFVVSRNKVQENLMPIWMDLLSDNSFSTYRDLLQNITFSPIMATYLDYRWNSNKSGSPDQNYAREIMQLFSIGLWELNRDGTPKLNSLGAPIPTYSQADVSGLSHVFTGLDLPTGGDRAGTCRLSDGRLADNEVQMWHCEMSVWPYTSLSDREFLGVKIAGLDQSKLSANSEATVMAYGRKNIATALDTLANHANTAPFISKLMIQRFTTSNPSPAYVGRVAAKFEDNGSGVRGDFKSVVKQILLDPEARLQGNAGPFEFGKLREPILATAQLNRLLKSNDGRGNVWAGSAGCKIYHDVISEMERPFGSATVFNYYRPSYTPASGNLAAKNLVSPEMQITDTNSVVEWSRFVEQALQRGGTGCANAARVQNSFAFDELWAESLEADRLADKVLLLLAPGADVGQLRPALTRSINSLPSTTDQDRINRIKLAVMMTMLTPEYRVQR